MSEAFISEEVREEAEKFSIATPGEGDESKGKEEGLPKVLKEFGEIPGGYESVFITISKESIDHVAENGLRIKDNRMTGKRARIEELFKEAADERGIVTDRTNCIFAYPRKSEVGGIIRLREGGIVLEAKIDPNKAVVANAEAFTEAGEDLSYGSEYAKDWAVDYWENSMPFSEYLAEGIGQEEEYDYRDFTFPEVLIPESIPLKRLKVVEYIKK